MLVEYKRIKCFDFTLLVLDMEIQVNLKMALKIKKAALIFTIYTDLLDI